MVCLKQNLHGDGAGVVIGSLQKSGNKTKTILKYVSEVYNWCKNKIHIRF